MIFKEKAEQFNADAEIQGLLAEINQDDPEMEQFEGAFTAQKAADLKAFQFDRKKIAARGLGYEKLDQLTNELLLGVHP
jgi:xylose isomerase